MTNDVQGRLFIGWLDASGKALATALGTWAKQLFPRADVTLAPDVRDGCAWQLSLPVAARGASAAMVCVIGQQASSPWLHLQLGVCARVLAGKSPVVPVLLDLEPEELAATPLGMFQGVRPTQRDFAGLVRDLGQSMAETDDAMNDALKRFEADWPELLQRLERVPGSSVQSIQVVLVLPEMVIPVPSSASHIDEEWASMVRRMTAMQTLSGFKVERFASSDLEPLDLTREEWMRAPQLLSRLRTRSIALVHRDVKARYQNEAKAIAQMAKLQLARSEGRR